MSTTKVSTNSPNLSSIEKIVVEPLTPGDLDPDAEFGGTEARRRLEKKLLWKLDLRMSILVFIYILNYVSSSISCVERYLY